MKRIIIAAKTTEYNGYSIYDTGFGYKVYKDGQLVSDTEFESIDDAVDLIDDMPAETSEVAVEAVPEPERNWLEEFSNYASHLATRVYPDGDRTYGVYSTGDKVLQRFLDAFKKQNPDCDLQKSHTFKNGAWLYVVR